ncbi:MAG: Bax inhibitor-1/YccA family protein [Bacteroidetes bacterium]|nr:Bax inhibitor-1/YccA family protein [Bacteroidota bacterium]
MSTSMPGAVVQTDVKSFLLRVYNWMAMGLAITGLTAFAVSSSDTLLQLIFGNPILFWGLFIVEFLMVLGLSAAINKIPSIVAIGLFFAYAFLNGVTLSFIFLLYTHASIYSTFLICAMMFASVSVLGYITKMDLSKMGSFLFMALIGLIIASVVNIFLANSTLYWIISYAGVLIFVGLTAYDTQKIKQMAYSMESGSETGKKAAVIGALQLYLDFINMFLFLLRILGNRR